jgi:hypothetical protein
LGRNAVGLQLDTDALQGGTPSQTAVAETLLVGFTCIIIIDTIILTNYTNNAYIFDTYDTSQGTLNPSSEVFEFDQIYLVDDRYYYAYTHILIHSYTLSTIVFLYLYIIYYLTVHLLVQIHFVHARGEGCA